MKVYSDENITLDRKGDSYNVRTNGFDRKLQYTKWGDYSISFNVKWENAASMEYALAA